MSVIIDRVRLFLVTLCSIFSRDPYLDPANDNWKLAPNIKSKGRKTKNEEFEMKRKSE